MSSPRRVVVVGGGIAGVTAADALRQNGFDGDLTIVGDERHPAYSRPALSKALLRDPDGLTAHELPPAIHGGTELRGVGAVGLDVDARMVLLDDGGRLAYDGLVIATGCRARRLGEGNEDAPDELTLRTIDDAWRLRARVADRPSVVVVGADRWAWRSPRRASTTAATSPWSRRGRRCWPSSGVTSPTSS